MLQKQTCSKKNRGICLSCDLFLIEAEVLYDIGSRHNRGIKAGEKKTLYCLNLEIFFLKNNLKLNKFFINEFYYSKIFFFFKTPSLRAFFLLSRFSHFPFICFKIGDRSNDHCDKLSIFVQSVSLIE